MTDKDKNASIEYILSQGFVEPTTLRERIIKMHRVLGWKFIFWDFSYSLIFVCVTLLGVMFLLRHMPTNYYPHSIAVGFSPVLFLLIMLFAEMSERACGLYELKQTCRFTSRQITALRCIYYSIAGIGFAILVTAFTTDSTSQFFRILPLCLGGLFLCAVVKLSIIRLAHNKWAIPLVSAVWLLLNIALPLIFGERWEVLLPSIPLFITIIFAISGVVMFIYQTNKMLSEEKNYAIA